MNGNEEKAGKHHRVGDTIRRGRRSDTKKKTKKQMKKRKEQKKEAVLVCAQKKAEGRRGSKARQAKDAPVRRSMQRARRAPMGWGMPVCVCVLRVV